MSRVSSSDAWPATYRAFQVLGVVAPQLATGFTLYGVAAHHGAEANLFFATFFTQGWPGFLLAAFIRLALTISVIAQTAYLWRRGQHNRGLLTMGWIILFVWTLLTAIDALHDAWVVLR